MEAVGLPHPLFLLGENGAHTKRVSVLIGSQLIGTVQIKRAITLHGSHISPSGGVLFVDPSKGIHGDEK